MSELMDHMSYLMRICIGPNGMGVDQVSGQTFTDAGWNINIGYCRLTQGETRASCANTDCRQRQFGTSVPGHDDLLEPSAN